MKGLDLTPFDDWVGDTIEAFSESFFEQHYEWIMEDTFIDDLTEIEKRLGRIKPKDLAKVIEIIRL